MSKFIKEKRGTYCTAEVTFNLQDGPSADIGINGVHISEIIEWVKRKLEEDNFHFPSREKENAIAKLEESLLWFLPGKSVKISDLIKIANKQYGNEEKEGRVVLHELSAPDEDFKRGFA